MTHAITMMFCLVNLLGRIPAQSVAPSRPTQDPVLLKASDAYLAAVLGGDAAAVAALYREEGIEMPPGAAPIVGKYVVILKHARGAWRASYVIYNSDRPPTMPPTSASR